MAGSMWSLQITNVESAGYLECAMSSAQLYLQQHEGQSWGMAHGYVPGLLQM